MENVKDKIWRLATNIYNANKFRCEKHRWAAMWIPRPECAKQSSDYTKGVK